jgi:hypothetical protein
MTGVRGFLTQSAGCLALVLVYFAPAMRSAGRFPTFFALVVLTALLSLLAFGQSSEQGFPTFLPFLTNKSGWRPQTGPRPRASSSGPTRIVELVNADGIILQIDGNRITKVTEIEGSCATACSSATPLPILI